MSNESATIVQRLWNYCHVLRDDGVSYGDYVEQLTYLLFLKMADEQTRPPLSRPSTIPAGLDWPSLLARDGDELETHYRHILEGLGKEPGLLGVIFRKAQNKIQDPAKLRRLSAKIMALPLRFTTCERPSEAPRGTHLGLTVRTLRDTIGAAMRALHVPPARALPGRWPRARFAPDRSLRSGRES